MNQYFEIKVSDNDDQYFKTKSKLIKQKGLFGLGFSIGCFYEYQNKEGHELLKWLYVENEKQLKIKFMRKFKNADEEIFKKLMRIYLHTSPLDGIWVCDQNGNE